MRKKSRLFPVLCLLGLVSIAQGTVSRQPDPSIDVLHYVFDLTLSDETDSITGQTEIRVRFIEDALSTLTLHLIAKDPKEQDEPATGMTVTAITQASKPVPFTHEDDQIIITLTDPPADGETRTYEITYAGIPADGLVISKNKHGERTFFGDNFPNRARHWLPTLDHPSDKATCEFIVTLPSHYQIIGKSVV